MNPARHCVTHFLLFLILYGFQISTGTVCASDSSAPDSSAPDSYKIRKISISGIFTGKDSYKKLYRLSKGMFFNQDEHNDSIKAIERFLKKNGYLSGAVQPFCRFNHKDRTVSIGLHIVTGSIFTIRSVVCNSSTSDSDGPSINEILKKFQKRLESRLKNSYCTQEELDCQASKMAAYLAKKGYLFAHIQMERTQHDNECCVDVIFKCALKHKKQFIFRGNSTFTSEQLYHVCAEFGKALLIIPPEFLIRELEDFYKKQGYFDVLIACQEDASTLIFSLKEGSRVHLESVKLIGLPEKNTGKDPSLFFSILVNQEYDSKKIAQATYFCTHYFIEQGYGYISLEDTQVIKQPSCKYQLVLTFNLGSKIEISHIAATDFQELIQALYQQPWCNDYERFLNQYTPTPGIVNLKTLARMRKFLQKHLHDNGYLYTHVTPQFLIENGVNLLKWSFSGDKKMTRFGDTVIKGSCDLSDAFMRRAVTYKKGDIWNKKRLDETALTLRNFGVFDQVTVFPENITQPEDEKAVIIQVQDSDPFELRTRAGFQGVGTNLSWRGGATYKFGGTFLWKNPRKCADIFSLQIDITRFLRYITLMYQVAFLGPFPVRQQFKVYSNRYDQPVVLGSREILYRFEQDGALWEVSHDYGGTKWGIASGVDWMRISDISSELSRAIDFTTRFIDKRIPYFFCEPSLYMSDVDNRLDPLMGWYLVLSSKALVPCGVKNAASIKFLLEQGNYIPLHKPSHTVFALRFRLGTILYQQFSTIMPPERFYLGGAYSLRGYEPDLAPPLNFYRNHKQELIVVPTGGRTMMNGNFELRFSIFKSLGGTLFTDIGLLTQSGATDIRMRDVLGASGFGLRWNTPVGPLRFDIGWKWKQFPGNQQFYDQGKYAWFLTLGNAF